MQRLRSIGWISAAVVIAVAGLAAAPAARASTVVTATWTGTIRAGNDAGDHFGGALNTGDAFKLVSVFSTGKGTYDPTGGGSISGGGSAILTINGHDFSFALDPSSYKLDSSIGLFLGDTSQTFLSLAFFAPGMPGSILTPFDADCAGAGFCSGTFEIAGAQFSGASIDATHLTVTVAATPLPASLPLLVSALAGFALLGSGRAMRRRAG